MLDPSVLAMFSEEVAYMLATVVNETPPPELTEDQKPLLLQMVFVLASDNAEIAEASEIVAKVNKYMNMLIAIHEMLKNTIASFAVDSATRAEKISMMKDEELKSFLCDKAENLLREFRAVCTENQNQKGGDTPPQSQKRLTRKEQKLQHMKDIITFAAVSEDFQEMYKALEKDYGDAIVELFGFRYVFNKMKKNQDKAIIEGLSALQTIKSGGKVSKENNKLLPAETYFNLKQLSVGRMESVLLDLTRQFSLVKNSLRAMTVENIKKLKNIDNQIKLLENVSGPNNKVPFYKLEFVMRTDITRIFSELTIRLKNSEELLRIMRKTQCQLLQTEKIWAIELRNNKKLSTVWTPPPLPADQPIPPYRVFDDKLLWSQTKDALDSFVVSFGSTLRQSRLVYTGNDSTVSRHSCHLHNSTATSFSQEYAASNVTNRSMSQSEQVSETSANPSAYMLNRLENDTSDNQCSSNQTEH